MAERRGSRKSARLTQAAGLVFRHLNWNLPLLQPFGQSHSVATVGSNKLREKRPQERGQPTSRPEAAGDELNNGRVRLGKETLKKNSLPPFSSSRVTLPNLTREPSISVSKFAIPPCSAASFPMSCSITKLPFSEVNRPTNVSMPISRA